MRMTENVVREVKSEKMSGISRFFSFRVEKEEDPEFYLPEIAKKQREALSRKHLRINFEHFQKAFE
jgi:hypothetical protein